MRWWRRSSGGPFAGAWAVGLTKYILLLSALAAGGCTATHYPGISDVEVTSREQQRLGDLVAAAERGEKHAQVKLGDLYLCGTGVPRDRELAEKLYESAAKPGGGRTHMFVPGTPLYPGHVQVLDKGPAQAGLPEARLRLHMFDEEFCP
tara:strand:+ start:32934 stop:33380 length:447 start_codon:yes stop_codon:yes gene_type:complete